MKAIKPKSKEISPIFRFITIIVCFVMFSSAFFNTSAATASEDEMISANADNIYILCVDNGILLYDKNADSSFTPSSMSKMMTGLLACEILSDRFNDSVTISADMMSGVSGDKMGIVVDETMPIGDLIYGLLFCGYNDCANSLAVIISGSLGEFVRLMNSRAAELGMNNTIYTTPTGSEVVSSRTTASDTAKLALECSKNELYMKISSEQKHKLSPTNKSGAVNIYNRNHLVSTFNEPRYFNSDCKGLFAGNMPSSKHSVVTMATHKERTYICVVANAKKTDTDTYSYTIVSSLLDLLYKRFKYKDIITDKEEICTLPVTMSDVISKVSIYAEKSINLFINTDEEDEIKISYRLNYSSLKAPVEEGTPVGYLTVTYKTQTETVKLVTKDAVEGSKFLYGINAITEFSQGRVFKATMASIIVLSAVAVLVEYKIQKKRASYGYLKRK